MLLRQIRILLVCLVVFVCCAPANAADDTRWHYTAALPTRAVAHTHDYLIDVSLSTNAGQEKYVLLSSAKERFLFNGACTTNRDGTLTLLREQRASGSGPDSITFSSKLTDSCVFTLGSGASSTQLTAQLFAKGNMRAGSDKKKRVAEYSLASPVFSTQNKSLNAKLHADFAENQESWLKWMNDAAAEIEAEGENLPDYVMCGLWITYEITYFDNSSLALRFQQSLHTGGAHPNHYASSFVYDIRSGEAERLDMSKAVLDPANKLRDLVRARLKAQEASWPEEAELSAADCALFHGGLEFRFPPYAVGSYAEGFYDVFLPWNELENYLNAALFKF